MAQQLTQRFLHLQELLMANSIQIDALGLRYPAWRMT
jgi:hypothetical protein